MADVKKQIRQLRSKIREHDYLYYVFNQPKITDQQYDKLFTKLKKLEQENPQLITPDSPTQRVSEKPIEGFNSINHAVVMLSIDNTYNADELRAFDERVRKQFGTEKYDYVVELTTMNDEVCLVAIFPRFLAQNTTAFHVGLYVLYSPGCPEIFHRPHIVC